MEFLEKLYSNENFGMYLFAVIAILIVLFFIVLFFGKKDQAKTKKTEDSKGPEENIEPQASLEQGELNELPNQNELPALEPLKKENIEFKTFEKVEDGFKEITEETPLNVPVPEEPLPIVQEEIEPLPKPRFPNVVLNETITESKEEQKEEPISEPVLDKEFDFDALAAAISKELDSLNIEKPAEEKPSVPKEESKPVIEEKPVSFPTFESIIPDKLEEKKELPKEESPVIKQKPVMPTVFSSVYVNRADELKQPEKEEPVPVKPQFELPKMVDLPKKAEVVEKVEPKETFTVNTILNNLEDETYPIDKN